MANSTKISEYSTTAANNTSIDSIDIDENCAASGINNAIRSVLKHQADAFTQGTPIALDQTNNRVGIGTTSPQSNINSSTKVLHLKQDSANGSGVVMESDSCITEIISGSNASYFYNYTSDPMLFGTNNTERMRIDSSGNVGIGTSSPQSILHCYAASEPVLRFQNSGTGTGSSDGSFVGLGSGTYGLRVHNFEATPIRFATSNSERMQIDSSGNLRVANTSMAIDTSSNTATGLSVASSGLLHVATDDNITGILVQKLNGSGSENALFFLRGSSGVGSIRTTDSATAFNTTSDHRVKENVVDMTGAIARVKQLAPKRFNFIIEPDTTVDGFLAHEAQTVVPEAVHGTHNEVDDDGNAVMQGIDQSKLVPLLTGALKEAITKIETLETEMTALKARVTALEA